jgi:hypothetical protein
MQTNIDRSDNEEDEWVRSYHERLRQIRVVDALDGIPACPHLPADLDDPVALDNWTAAWNAWIVNEAVQLQRPLLKEMTPETLAGIVRAEKRARDHLAAGAQQRELADARNALSTLEVRLRAMDPTYEAKKALLVPILRPIFLQLLTPSKWVTAFEKAYAQTRVPADDRTPATSRVAIPDKIFEEFNASTPSGQRNALLAMLKAIKRCQLLLVTVLGKVAVKAAASPHLPHAEMVEIADAKKRSSEMSIERLVKDLTSARTFDIVDARAKVGKAFDAATTSDQRARVLAIFKEVMDEGERQLVSQGNQTQLLEDFRKARAQDYKIFIAQECTVGLDSPGGGDISIELLMTVTNREIAASRMTEGHSMRKLAVEGAAAPHFSHAELIAKHAKLKEEAEKSKTAPAPKTVGEKLKGLFRRS